jgi:AcrR family transcriptional regulator
MADFDIDAALDRAMAEPESRRAGVLRAAERLFAARGYEGVRVRDVADAAGVNVATLHLHWKSKAALYEAVCRLHARELMAFVERARREAEAEDLPISERLPGWVSAAVELLARRPSIAPLALQSVADQTPPDLPTLFHHDISLFRGFEREIRKAMAGREQEVEPIFALLTVFYLAIVAFTDSPLQRALLGGSVYTDADVRERVARFVRTLATRLLEPAS